MGQLAPILQRRSPVIHILTPDQTVADAVEVMSRHQIGVVPIVNGSQLVGIFSERDLLRRVIAKGRDLEKTTMHEVMTPDPVTATADEDRQSALRKMQSVGCRHLPIVAGDSIIDMLSMRDLLSTEIQEREQEIEALRGYIQGQSG